MDKDEILFFIIIVIFSATSKIPFININLMLPFNKVICYIAVVCNILSWFLLEVWALGLDCKYYIEKLKFNTYLGLIKLIIIVGLSMLSQVPNVYPALEYNDKKYSILIWISVTVALSFFPIKSMFLLIEKMSKNVTDNKKELYLLIFKEKMLGKSNEYKLQNYLNEDIKFFIKNEMNDIEEIYNDISSKIKFLFNPLTIFFLFFYEFFVVDYTFSKTKIYIYHSEKFSVFISIIVCITTFFFTGKVIFHSLLRYYNIISGSFYYKKIGYKYETFKFSYYIFQLLVFISSFFSIGVYYVVVTNFYENNKLRDLLTFVVCFVIFMILHTGSINMVNYFFNFLLKKYGTINDKNCIIFNENILAYKYEDFDSDFFIDSKNAIIEYNIDDEL